MGCRRCTYPSQVKPSRRDASSSALVAVGPGFGFVPLFSPLHSSVKPDAVVTLRPRVKMRSSKMVRFSPSMRRLIKAPRLDGGDGTAATATRRDAARERRAEMASILEARPLCVMSTRLHIGSSMLRVALYACKNVLHDAGQSNPHTDGNGRRHQLSAPYALALG